MDSIRFSAAVARALLRKPEGGGIGMLGEKTLHSALKYYYEPDETCHEQRVSGFFADAMSSEGILEVQTRSLFSLNRKLREYPPEVPVTLVHPVIRRRKLIYRDPETGELSRPRLSPKQGRVTDAFWELVHIRENLRRPGLVVVIPIVDAEEYRTREEPKRRGRRVSSVTKYELVPTELTDEWVFVGPEDWLRVLPEGIAEKGFTVKELSRAARIPERDAQTVCSVLLAAGALTRARCGRAYRYFRNSSNMEET
ncbi:MAG: hypothetical protein J5772_01035 [Clostridia bacterium]|nr:hypothetical protein [Clostridia bacterium]